MCGRIRAVGRLVSPGSIMQFNSLTGSVIGKWGIGSSNIYNARFDKLPTTWRGTERGVLTIDGFYEKKVFFERGEGKKLDVAVIFNRQLDFAIVTTEASSQISAWHHRMPLVLPEQGAKDWLENAWANPVIVEQFLININSYQT